MPQKENEKVLTYDQLYIQETLLMPFRSSQTTLVLGLSINEPTRIYEE